MTLRQRKLGILLMAFALLYPCGCNKRAPVSEESNAKNRIAVSSSYLEAALRDVQPGETPLIRLAGPSMCPGHFDMRPSQFRDLAQCRLLIRFDFQSALDKKLANRDGVSLRTFAATASGGLCNPETYFSVCRQIADHLVASGDISRSEADKRLDAIAKRLKELSDDVHRRIDEAAMRDAPVLTSGHQADFCRWLGLRVVAAFSAGDAAGIVEIDQTVKAGEAEGVKLLIANEPEGRRLADALAERLGARVVLFANFPDPAQQPAFDALVVQNTAALLETSTSGEDPQ